MKLRHATLLLSCGLFLASQMSFAQSANVYFGQGTAIDSSANTLIDTFATGKPFTTPKMGGSFSDAGTSILFTKHFGVGADIAWRDARGAFAGLQYRPMFYNFDAVWEPFSTRHFKPEVHAGIGGMHIGYSYTSTQCDQFAGCSTFRHGVETSDHFQAHVAAAARFYVTDKVFVRPAVDAHYVNNLFQFGSNWVPEYLIGVGYSFGRE